MSAVLVSLIAVAGTLLGSLSTYLFQRRTALHTERVTREERLRQDRLAACGTFAAVITEVKRAVITAWFRRDEHDDEWRAAMTEADRMGAARGGRPPPPVTPHGRRGSSAGRERRLRPDRRAPHSAQQGGTRGARGRVREGEGGLHRLGEESGRLTRCGCISETRRQTPGSPTREARRFA